MTTERDLIQQLTERLDHLHSNYDLPSQSALIAEALDYLDQPEPEYPSDQELLELMTEQHRATESEWHCLKARTCGDKADQVAYSTIHELLNRIEALEAAELHPHHGDTMTTDWKALCAELVNSWIEGRDIVGPMHRACTALAQPETPSHHHHHPGEI